VFLQFLQTNFVQQLDEPCDKDNNLSTCERFSVYNEQGKAVYEFKDFQVEGFTFERFAQFSEQIVIESNGGGTDNFLTIVDTKDSKCESRIEINIDNEKLHFAFLAKISAFLAVRFFLTAKNA
jgi:hypothetical protein